MSRLKQLVTRLRRPDMREVAVAQVSDKYSEYPSNGLTPVKLAEILREADAGDVLRQMELFEEMEEKDPHLFSQLQTRKNAVTGLDFEVIPFGDEPLDKEIADFIEEQLNGIESFEDVENDLLDAIGKGFAVSEILWGYDEGHVVVQDIKTRHQKRFFWDTLDDSFKVRTKDVPEGILLPANKFIVHKYKARSGHTSRAGILRVVAWMYLFKNYDLKDWVSFAEIYGLPLRLGKYAPGASDSDKAALMRALIQIGSDAAGIIPDGTSIDFITTEKTSSSDLYERLARYCDEQISKAILGQTLTSDSGGGSYAQSKTHNDVRHDLTVADCKALASTLRRDLIRPLCIFNFGEDKRIPYIRFDCEESEDLTQTATILGTLIEKVGLRIPTSFVYKKFSIPEPEEGDEIAKPTYGGGMGGVLPFKSDALLSLKAGADAPIGTQQHIDRLAAAALHKGVGSFKRAFEPVLKMIENADSLEQLRELMEDDAAVAELYRTRLSMKGIISQWSGTRRGVLYALTALGYDRSRIELFAEQDAERWAEFIIFLNSSKPSGVTNLSVIDAQVRKVKEGSSKPAYGMETIGGLIIRSQLQTGFSHYPRCGEIVCGVWPHIVSEGRLVVSTVMAQGGASGGDNPFPRAGTFAASEEFYHFGAYTIYQGFASDIEAGSKAAQGAKVYLRCSASTRCSTNAKGDAAE